MSNHVDTITVSVTKFEPKLYVQSFELVLAVNDIPTIFLNVLPVEPPKGGSGQYTTASSPDIAEITDLYTKLVSKSLRLDATATIEIEVKSDSGDGEPAFYEANQKVKLEDWVLSDVGLSSVTPTAAPVLTAVFRHQAVKLDRTGSIYEEVKNKQKLTEIFKSIDGEGLIEYMDNLYEMYSSEDGVEFYEIAPKSLGGPREEDESKIMEFRFRLADYKPGQFIEDNTNGFFLAEASDKFLTNIRIATGYFARPQAFCDSTWARLVQELSPMYLTTIVPTYDKPKLTLEPFSPWQAPSRSIDVRSALAIDVVSTDPAPIIGTAVNKDVEATDHNVDGANRGYTGSDEKDITHAFYFPEKSDSKAGNLGEIFNVGEARVVSAIIDIDEAANAKIDNNGPVGEDLESAGNVVTQEDRETMDEAYAKAMFLITYRRNCKAGVTTIPMFRDASGNMLYPGRVLTVYYNGDHLFNGYVTQIITSGSAEGGGGCTTRIMMTHARPPTTDATLVDEGTENPCYPEDITRE